MMEKGGHMNILKSLICLSILLFACGINAQSETTQLFSYLPGISVKYVKEYYGKSIRTAFAVHVSNRYKFPIWVLITSGNNSFPENGVLKQFYSEPSFEYFAKEGKYNFIRLMFLYPERDIVAGLYLDEYGGINLENLILPSSESVNYFEIALIKKIFVNDKVDLIKWLPFNFLSTASQITRRIDISGFSESDEDLPKVDWPKEKIEYLKFEYLEIYRWEKVDAKTSQLKQRHYRKE